MNWGSMNAGKRGKYKVIYSIVPIRKESHDVMCGAESITLETHNSNIIIKELNPRSFYSVSVYYEAIETESIATVISGNNLTMYNYYASFTTCRISIHSVVYIYSMSAVPV